MVPCCVLQTCYYNMFVESYYCNYSVDGGTQIRVLSSRAACWRQPCSETPLTYVSSNVKDTGILKSNAPGLNGLRKLKELRASFYENTVGYVWVTLCCPSITALYIRFPCWVVTEQATDLTVSDRTRGVPWHFCTCPWVRIWHTKHLLEWGGWVVRPPRAAEYTGRQCEYFKLSKLIL